MKLCHHKFGKHIDIAPVVGLTQSVQHKVWYEDDDLSFVAYISKDTVADIINNEMSAGAEIIGWCSPVALDVTLLSTGDS